MIANNIVAAIHPGDADCMVDPRWRGSETMPQRLGLRHPEIRVVQKVLMHPLEQLMIVAIIYANPNQNGPGNLECLLERWPDLIGCFDHEAGCPKSFGILHDIDWPKINSRRTFVFRLLLDGHHVVGAVDPNHMNEIQLQPHCGLEFHYGKEKSAVARDGQRLFVWSYQARCNAPRKCDAKRLLTIPDQNLPRSKAEEKMRDP